MKGAPRMKGYFNTQWIFPFILGIFIGFIVVSWVVRYDKAQSVKEALSKLSHGKIDLSVKENMDNFKKEWVR